MNDYVQVRIPAIPIDSVRPVDSSVFAIRYGERVQAVSPVFGPRFL